ncbi:MAG: hypothetical protein WAU91_07125 [Desulfatitalea sp.]
MNTNATSTAGTTDDADLPDAAFAVIEPLLASRPKLKSGRPMEYDGWVAYRWFRTLSKDGTWRAVHDELHRVVRTTEGRSAEPTACSMDSPSA